jgi:hypothetical protein
LSDWDAARDRFRTAIAYTHVLIDEAELDYVLLLK